MAATTTTIGLVGLGHMGGAMAARFLAALFQTLRELVGERLRAPT